MTTTNKIPLWQVGAYVISEDRHSDGYLDGKKIPCRVVSPGFICVHGQDVADARARTERVLRETYQDVVKVDFFNTKKISEDRYFAEGFEGLERVN